MSAQFAKDQVSFTAPMNFSDAAPRVFAPASGGVVRAVTNWFAGVMQRRAVFEELGSLSDHELADIGLTRSDIPYVFDRGFADSRNCA